MTERAADAPAISWQLRMAANQHALFSVLPVAEKRLSVKKYTGRFLQQDG